MQTGNEPNFFAAWTDRTADLESFVATLVPNSGVDISHEPSRIKAELNLDAAARHSAGSVGTTQFANTEREKDTTEDSDSDEPRGGGRRQGGRGGTSMSTAARRTAELQEKNRNAQRRFRQRQKAKVSELEDHVSALTSQISSLVADKAALDSRVGILNRVLRMREEHIEALQQQGRTTNEAVTEEQMEDLQVSDQHGQAMTYTPEQVKAFTHGQAVSIWKGYVNQMAVLLVEADAGTNSSTQPTLQRLVGELCSFVMKMHMLNPLTTREFTASKLEDTPESTGEVEGSERWLTLARALALSPQQRQEIVQLRRLFLSKMNGIMQQRREINQSLAYTMPAPSFSRATAIQQLRTHESIERLRLNLKEEHMLKMDWAMTLLRHTLTPVQVARALVQAWPWAPDTLAMATWVAAEENEPDALTMLTQESRQFQTAPSGLGGGGSVSAGSGPSGLGAGSGFGLGGASGVGSGHEPQGFKFLQQGGFLGGGSASYPAGGGAGGLGPGIGGGSGVSGWGGGVGGFSAGMGAPPLTASLPKLPTYTGGDLDTSGAGAGTSLQLGSQPQF